MALVVNPLLTDIDLAESATPWTTGALDPAKFVQGSNSIGWYTAKNARNSNGVSGKSIAHAAGDHLYWWNASDVISRAEPQTTGTTTASGVTIRVTLSDGAYREWHVAGSDTWDGGWRCFVIDLGHTGSQLYASGGTWSTANNITDVDIYIDLSNSGNIRNVPANQYADAIRVGTGLQVYNENSTDAAFDIGNVAAIAEATAQAYGVTTTIDGVTFLQGELVLGDGAGTNHLDCASEDEVIVFSERDGGDGYGFVADALYKVTLEGNATASDQSVRFGVKVGTGDAMTGRNGTIIRAGSSVVRWQFIANDADLHSLGFYGSTFQGAFLDTSSLGWDGGTAPTTLYEIGGCTFDACGQIDADDAVGRNNVVLNTQAPSTTGALSWLDGTTDWEQCLFVNNVRALHVATLTGDMTIVGMEFQGNTFDVEYGGTGDYDLNWSDAPAAPTVNDASTGTLTPVNTVNTTITGVPSGAEWRLYEADATQGTIGSTELDGAESHTGGNIIYADAYSTDTLAALQVMAAGYEEFLRYFTLQSTAQTVEVILEPETNT